MKLKEDILKACKRFKINPYKEEFKPSDLGIDSTKYGSFSDYCSENDTKSGQWNTNIILKVAERDSKGRPFKYLLIDKT